MYADVGGVLDQHLRPQPLDQILEGAPARTTGFPPLHELKLARVDSYSVRRRVPTNRPKVSATAPEHSGSWNIPHVRIAYLPREYEAGFGRCDECFGPRQNVDRRSLLRWSAGKKEQRQRDSWNHGVLADTHSEESSLLVLG